MNEEKDNAIVRMADMAINPPADRLPEHANLSQMQAFTFSLLEMNIQAAKDLMDKCRARKENADSGDNIILYADIFQSAYMRRSRSIAGRTTDASFKLAEAEIEAKSGEFDGNIEPREIGRR